MAHLGAAPKPPASCRLSGSSTRIFLSSRVYSNRRKSLRRSPTCVAEKALTVMKKGVPVEVVASSTPILSRWPERAVLSIDNPGAMFLDADKFRRLDGPRAARFRTRSSQAGGVVPRGQCQGARPRRSSGVKLRHGGPASRRDYPGAASTVQGPRGRSEWQADCRGIRQTWAATPGAATGAWGAFIWTDADGRFQLGRRARARTTLIVNVEATRLQEPGPSSRWPHRTKEVVFTLKPSLTILGAVRNARNPDARRECHRRL